MKDDPNKKAMRLTFPLMAALLLVTSCGAPASVGGPTAAATPAPAASTTIVTDATVAPVASVTAAQATAVAPTAAPAPSATNAPATTVVPTAAPAPTAAPSSGGADVPYLDDRSSAALLIDSYYNAINRKEYARAYAYWQPGAANLPAYDAFAQGYGATNSVQVRYGPITGDAGAGQQRYSVPLALAAQTSGGPQFFVGCYTLHLANPSAQATPPFQWLAIEEAAVQQSNVPASEATLAQACAAQGQPLPAQSGAAAGNNEAGYADNRSDPTNVLRSFYNAINRHEYLRAYSYWQDTTQIPTLNDFEQGYAATKSVTLTAGNVQGDAGAGQYVYRVPVKIESHLEDGSAQLFAGCYTLHLANPSLQAPPFVPLGIVSAAIQQVQDDASATALMGTSCQGSQ